MTVTVKSAIRSSQLYLRVLCRGGHPMSLSRAYIGLGSNIGDRVTHLKEPCVALRQRMLGWSHNAVPFIKIGDYWREGLILQCSDWSIDFESAGFVGRLSNDWKGDGSGATYGLDKPYNWFGYLKLWRYAAQRKPTLSSAPKDSRAGFCSRTTR